MEIYTTRCPGCEMQLYSPNNSLATDYNASVACLELYHKLTYYTLSLQDTAFVHQLAVDTYAAQHFGQQVKPVTITFALVGLYLVNEKGYTGKEVQQIHTRLAQANALKNWLYFPMPHGKTIITVKQVLESPKKKEMVYTWNAAVWELWKDQKVQIIELLKQFLDIK